MINDHRLAVLVDDLGSILRVSLPIAKPSLESRCANLLPLVRVEIAVLSVRSLQPSARGFGQPFNLSHLGVDLGLLVRGLGEGEAEVRLLHIVEWIDIIEEFA